MIKNFPTKPPAPGQTFHRQILWSIQERNITNVAQNISENRVSNRLKMATNSVSLLPVRGKIYFQSLEIQAELLTYFDDYIMAEMTLYQF